MPLAALDLGDNTFLVYVGALAVSGLILAVLALTGFGGAGVGSRIISGLVALAFLGYAGYLAFIFEGGEYRLFLYAFIVPALLLFRAFQGWRAKKSATQPSA